MASQWQNPLDPHLKLNTSNLKLAQRPGLAEEEALKKGIEEKSKKFMEKGAEVYAKA